MIIRLGDRPGHGSDLAGAGYRRILQGQVLHLHTISDAVVAIRAWVRVIYDDGSGQLLTVPETPRSGSRVAEDLASADVVIQNGWVVNAEVEMLTADIKRGQTYVRMTVEPFGAALLSDYCFSEFGHVSLGTFIQPGPGGGAGNLRWVAIKANGVPATFDFTFAVSNVIRSVRGFVWYYASSGDVASRLLDARLRQPGAGLPTGFGNAIDVWAATTLTLTANQDGSVFADPKRSGTNDNTVVVIDDAASAPSPFPLLVAEDDEIFFRGALTAEEAADFDAVWGLFEDWVVL